jgi:hypothetical protein
MIMSTNCWLNQVKIYFLYSDLSNIKSIEGLDRSDFEMGSYVI